MNIIKSKNKDHYTSDKINMYIINILKCLSNKISIKINNIELKLKINLNNKDKYINCDKLLSNNNNKLIYSFFNVQWNSIAHGCCFYYNFKDGKYYFVSNKKEIEIPLEYISNSEYDMEEKINTLYKKLTEQNIVDYLYKLKCDIDFLYKL